MKKVCIILILAMAVSTLSGCYYSRSVIHHRPWGYNPYERQRYMNPAPRVYYVPNVPRHHVKPAPKHHHVKPAPRPHHNKDFKKSYNHNKAERHHKKPPHVRGQGNRGR